METYFNSHPHKEDDSKSEVSRIWDAISTHILTKRMTSPNSVAVAWGYISTHILTKRMTVEDLRNELVKSISTHILTKRMTVMVMGYRLCKVHFNSHPHEEDDKMAVSLTKGEKVFQLTSSRRG